MAEICIRNACTKYSEIYPTECLGECSLDPVDEETRHRRIITLTSDCRHEPKYRNEIERWLAEAAKRSNEGHPFS